MKKIIFAICLLFPLGLYIYGKVSPMLHTAAEVKQVTTVVRQIPLDNRTLKDAFKKLPAPPSVPKAPKAPVKHRPVVKASPAAPSYAPATPAAPTFEEKQPTEFCAFPWLSAHCGSSVQ